MECDCSKHGVTTDWKCINCGANAPEPGMEVNEKGGKANGIKGRYDLLPPEALKRAAVILGENLEGHGKDNWKKIDRWDHLNHALNHIFEYLKGEESEDKLGHALCRLLFACSKLEED